MLIPKAVFAISKLVARDPSRYAINGISLKRTDDGQCVATVTDGRRFLTTQWDDAEYREDFPSSQSSTNPVSGFHTLVKKSQWDRVGKTIPKSRVSSARPELNYCLLDEQRHTDINHMSSSDGKATSIIDDDILEGNFPDLQNSISQYVVGCDAVEIDVNPQLFIETLQSLEAATGEDILRENRNVRLTIPINPTMGIRIDGGQNISGASKNSTQIVTAIACIMPRLPERVPILTARALATPLGQSQAMLVVIRQLDATKLSPEVAAQVTKILNTIDKTTNEPT